MAVLLFITTLMDVASSTYIAAQAKGSSSFEDNFDIMWFKDHFSTSEDGQIWCFLLDKETSQLIIHYFLSLF